MALDGTPSLWLLDKSGRWRSRAWLLWVRSLRCCCADARCPNCGMWSFHLDMIEAAHWRHGASVGTGLKPDDFFSYPLTSTMHRRYHQAGQLPHKLQFRWVQFVWKQACSDGVLETSKLDVHDLLCDDGLRASSDELIFLAPKLARVLRGAFVSGDLVMHDPFDVTAF